MDKYKLVRERLCETTFVKENKIEYKTFKVNNITLEIIRDNLITLGKIKREILEENIYIATIAGGFFKKNNGIISVQLREDEIVFAIYAEEGLINQNTCGGIIDEIERKLEKYICKP